MVIDESTIMIIASILYHLRKQELNAFLEECKKEDWKNGIYTTQYGKISVEMVDEIKKNPMHFKTIVNQYFEENNLEVLTLE